MMLKLFSIVNCLVVLLVLQLNGHAAPVDENKSKEKPPIVITSQSLTADNKDNIALFEGSVVAKTEDLTIHSDKMTVYSDQEGNNIRELHAAGNVKVHKNETVLFADKAVYISKEEKIIFSGNPRAVQNGNVITGSEITFFLKNERAVVQKSRVVLQNREGLK